MIANAFWGIRPIRRRRPGRLRNYNEDQVFTSWLIADKARAFESFWWEETLSTKKKNICLAFPLALLLLLSRSSELSQPASIIYYLYVHVALSIPSSPLGAACLSLKLFARVKFLMGFLCKKKRRATVCCLRASIFFKIIRVAPRISGDFAVIKPRPLLGEGDAFMLRDKKKSVSMCTFVLV